MLGHEKGALEVDVDHPIPLSLIKDVDRSATRDPGGIDHDVELPVLGDHLGHQRRYAALVSDIELAISAIGNIERDHRCSLISEPDGACRSDPRCSAGDDRHLVSQSLLHRPPGLHLQR